MEENKNTEPKTLTEAFGLTVEWQQKNFEEMIQRLVDGERLSDVVLNQAKQLKRDEFDVEEATITQYEAKLVLTGMDLARVMIQLDERNRLKMEE